jgi:hypothetical protein
VRYREASQENLERATTVITAALLERIDRGEIRHDGRVPPFAMAAVAVEADIGSGELRYVLGRLVASEALRLVPGHGYYLRSGAVLAAGVKAGTR